MRPTLAPLALPLILAACAHGPCPFPGKKSLDCSSPDAVRRFKKHVVKRVTPNPAVADEWALALCPATAPGVAVPEGVEPERAAKRRASSNREDCLRHATFFYARELKMLDEGQVGVLAARECRRFDE